jgi:hypothetical protein
MIATGALIFFGFGCSSNASSPLIPPSADNPAVMHSASGTSLLGIFTVFVDAESMEATASVNRSAMFTANVTTFINQNPATLSFDINEIIYGPGYLDVDIDVSIAHPFVGLDEYRGYDVRGVFVGFGSTSVFDTHWIANEDLNQVMMPDPEDGLGGPDGYTRWYSYQEFSVPGMPLFTYVEGAYATPKLMPNATLNPYKYFCDELADDHDLSGDWFLSITGSNGVFSPGSVNTRNYYIRFPDATNVIFAYSIIANWEAPDIHPSNAPESIAISVTDLSDLWYVDGANNGGNIDLKFSLYGWGDQPESIYAESNLFAETYEFTAQDMTPEDGGSYYSTYDVEIDATFPGFTPGDISWVLLKATFPPYDYSNDFGVHNEAENDVLASYFRVELPVSPTQGNQTPDCDLAVVTPMPASDWGLIPVEFDASGSTDPDGDPLMYEWDFDDDGIFGDSYDSGTDENPIKNYSSTYQDQVSVRVTDDGGASSECNENIDVTVSSSKNISLRTDAEARDLGVDPNDGNLLIIYEDGQVWEYTLSTQYLQSSATNLFTAEVVPWTSTGELCNGFVDVAPNGNIFCSAAQGGSFPDAWPAQLFTSSGSPLGMAPSPGFGAVVPDVFIYSGSSGYANYSVVMAPSDGSGGNYQNNMYRVTPTGSQWAQNYYDDGPQPAPPTGIDEVYLGWVTGAEARDGQRFWVIEDDPEYYASRWDQYSFFYYRYDDQYFGTGSQGDADDTWNLAIDLTMDSSSRIYVLDELSSGQARIKIFTEGNPGTALTDNAAGDSSTISESPIAIEGTAYEDSTYGNLLFVLHGNGLPSKLSVFFMSEFGF